MKYTLYSNNILDILKKQLSNNESPLIYDHKGRKISGSEILKFIDSIAIRLATSGVRKGDRVVFLARPSIESILYFFALSRVGAVTVIVDPEMGQENFISRINFAKPKFILQDKILEKIEKYYFLKPILRFLNIWFPDNLPALNMGRITLASLSSIKKSSGTDTFIEERMDIAEDMLIIFTSGTISQPKGVVHSYRSLANALGIISSSITVSEQDFLYASQFYFLLIGLMVSARTYIPKNKSFDSKTFLALSAKYNITSAFLLPYEGEMIYKQCAKNNKNLPGSFKTILFGSAPVTRGFLSRFSTICKPTLKVYGIYGSTEMLPVAMIEMHEKINYLGSGDLLGKPVKGTSLNISDDKEIIARGPQLFARYLGDEINAQWFYSGDLGKIDAEGNLILLGRKKDMIIRKGYNIYPTLFEASISKIPGVIECSLIGVYDNKAEDEKIVLFIVSDLKGANFKKELQKMLVSGRYSIDNYAYPDEIVFIDEMPRFGRSKKTNKAALRDLAKEICKR